MVSQGAKIAVWWRRGGMALRIALFVLGCALLGFLVYWQIPEESTNWTNNLVVFALVNLNVAILFVLIFLVSRNVVKLVFDRRKRILGAKLRQRLVIALVGFTLIPTAILFFLASGLLTKAMQGWFSSPVESSLRGAVEVAKLHYDSLEEITQSLSDKIAIELQSQQLQFDLDEVLKAYLEKRRNEELLYSIRLIDEADNVFMKVENVTADIEDFSEPVPEKDAIVKARNGKVSTLFEEKGASQYIRVYRPLTIQGANYVFVVTHRIRPELTHAMSVVNDSFKEYEQFKLFRNPLRTGYLLTLAMITGLILFAAIWFGFYIAKELTIPIQHLAEGTKAIAKGNYDFNIRREGDDEIGLLVDSFNTMIGDLKNSRQEAESRRLFIETILANLALGLIAIDGKHRITSVNESAAQLFEFSPDSTIVGADIADLLTSKNFQQIKALLEQIEDSAVVDNRIAEQEVSIISQGRERKVLCTAGKILDVNQKWLGTVLLFDDITELSKAQQMSAWREVARRIAHEIKNPLTPLQLSAQRLQKLFAKESGHKEGVEAAQTIVEHVDSIKRLADEFSNFARMPTAEFELNNLNSLISNIISQFADNHDDVVFQFIAEAKMPELLMDREQLRRVLINLLDNAVSSIYRKKEAVKNLQGRIVVKTRYDKKHKNVSFEVADNGIGISEIDKTRIFQPYFTTKKEGSGLGLAVVTSIVSDHQGQIRLYDAPNGGAKFIVELPLSPDLVTQRRFASL